MSIFDVSISPTVINGILIAIPELALNNRAMITIIVILFSGKNQLATNLDADINLNGNPTKENNYPKKKNQNDTFTINAKIDPNKVNIHP